MDGGKILKIQDFDQFWPFLVLWGPCGGPYGPLTPHFGSFPQFPTKCLQKRPTTGYWLIFFTQNSLRHGVEGFDIEAFFSCFDHYSKCLNSAAVYESPHGATQLQVPYTSQLTYMKTKKVISCDLARSWYSEKRVLINLVKYLSI